MGRLRVGILISGRGSNMQALIAACAEASAPAEIVLVLSNDPAAAGLGHAAAAGIPTRAIPHRDFADRAAFDAALDTALRDAVLTHPTMAEGLAGLFASVPRG